jgi:uncharacterized repeat protein (TIGR04076 family)
MAEIKYPKIGNRVVAKVLEMNNNCTIGMKPGDEFDLSIHQCGEFCGLFYHNISGWVKTLQLGGTFPMGDDPDVQVWDCPNPMNRVKVELRRIKE